MKKSIAITIISILAVAVIALGVLFYLNNQDKVQQIEMLNTDVADKAGLIETLNADVSEKSGQIEMLNADVADKVGQIETLNADVINKAGQIEELNTDVADKKEQIEALKADVADKAGQIETLSADVADKSGQIEVLKADVADKASQIESLIGNIADKEKEISALQSVSAELNQRIETLDAALTEKETEIGRLNTEIKNTQIASSDRTKYVEETAGDEVEAMEQGFGGDVTVHVTLKDDKVQALVIDTPNETAGLGQRASEAVFTEQFIGKSAPFVYGENGIEALTGATVTSNAALKAINRAAGAKTIAEAEPEKKEETEPAVTEMKAEETAGNGQAYGVYRASRTNNFSKVTVIASAKNGVLTDVQILSEGEEGKDLLTDEIKAAWAKAILESGSAFPDAITGATLKFSAASVQEAMTEILANMSGETAEEPAAEPTAEPTAEPKEELTAEPTAEPVPEATEAPAAEEPAKTYQFMSTLSIFR